MTESKVRNNGNKVIAIITREVTAVVRSIPLWVFLLCLLLWALFTVIFGWAVKSTLAGSDRSGMLGKVAVEIASFPKTTNDVLLEITGQIMGTDKDEFRVAREKNADYTDFSPVPTVSGIDVQGLMMRADPAAMAGGWRLLVGAFSVDGEIENAALLMSPDLEIVKKWILDEIPVGELEPRSKHRKIVHGLAVLDDGSLIFTFDGSISLQRIDACGERQWATGGEFHHAVTLDDTGETVWTFSSKDTIAQVAVKDGAILRQISMDEVISMNPMIDIFEIRRLHSNDVGTNSRQTAGVWLRDKIHLNDVDPLPAAIADRFDGLDAGDLLVSARSLNLLFIIDPATLKVKWWRVGAVQRQHDPDWLPNGEILVLNNRMSRDFSEIVSIDSGTFERTTLFDGRQNDFYTRIRGKQQMLESGALVVTSPQQGRAFEVDRYGDVVFEIVNLKFDSDTTNYVMSEMKWLPMNSFDMRNMSCPQNN